MSGLLLTVPQATKLFALRNDVASRILGELSRDHVLRLTADGRYTVPPRIRIPGARDLGTGSDNGRAGEAWRPEVMSRSNILGLFLLLADARDAEPVRLRH